MSYVEKQLSGSERVLLALTAIVVFATWIRFTSSEFAVTDRRVIIKVGFHSRRTVETLLTKVEGIQVDQGPGGGRRRAISSAPRSISRGHPPP